VVTGADQVYSGRNREFKVADGGFDALGADRWIFA
jgi:hypothetical protein